MAKRKYTKRQSKVEPSEGLGDTVEKITKATGIKKAVELFSEVTGLDCGCDARKQKLNQIFRYKTPNCLTEIEYKQLATLTNVGVLRPAEQNQLNSIYNRVFNAKVKPTSCSSCLRDRVQQLKKVYKLYEDEKSNS